MYSRWICFLQVVQEFSKKNAEFPAATSDSATATAAGETIPVTEANLDGHDAPESLTEDASLSCQKSTPSRAMIKMLSCLFPSRIWWMITGHWVSEVLACSPHNHFTCEVACSADLKGWRLHWHNISGIIQLSIHSSNLPLYMYLHNEKSIVWTWTFEEAVSGPEWLQDSRELNWKITSGIVLRMHSQTPDSVRLVFSQIRYDSSAQHD